MKTLFTFFSLFIFMGMGLAQTVLFDNDCANTPTNWTMQGTQKNGYYLMNDDVEYVLSPIYDLTGYSNLVLVSNLRSYGGGGAPSCLVEYSLDGGSSWSSINKEFLNIPNSYTDYTWNIGVLNSTTVVFKWRRSNATGRKLRINNLKLEGDPGSVDYNSKAEDPSAQIVATSIPSTVQTSATAVDVFKFKISDLGTADGKPTNVTNIRIKKLSGSQLLDDWIQGFVLKDGSNIIPISFTWAGNNAAYVDLSINNSGDLSIADGSSKELTLAVFLKPSVVDNETFSFYIDADDNGFTSDNLGSGFASDFGTDVNSNTITITVAATKMIFQVQPVSTTINQTMSPAPVIAYVDAYNNVDVDIAGGTHKVTISSGGTLSSSSTKAVDPTAGLATFSNIIHSATATAIQLTANSATSSFTSISSSNFNITDIPVNPMVDSLYISEVSEGPNTNTEFLELYNPSSNPIDITNVTIVRMNASGNEEYSKALSSFSGDLIVPAGGYWVISRGANRSTFGSDWPSFPSSSSFMTGNNELYFGSSTARRWKITYDDGSKTVITIDDTQGKVGGSGKNSNRITPTNWTTDNSISNATPGAMNPNSELPIELLSFKAIYTNKTIKLHWQTASETNNDYFTIERSFDAEHFDIITTVRGAGNSNIVKDYQYTDKNIEANQTYYYRLKQTDYDGTSTYSSIISVQTNQDELSLLNTYVEGDVLSISIYSPSVNTLNVEVYDMNGQALVNQVVDMQKGQNDLSISVANLPQAIYLVRLSNKNFIKTQKVFIR